MATHDQSRISVRELTRFSHNEINKAFKTALVRKRFNALEFTLTPAQKSFGRILIITPRKSGNAPERNRLKRQLKAVFFEHKLFEKPFDVIVYARFNGGPYDYTYLQELLARVYADYEHHAQKTSHNSD